jgi:serine/threonine protein kinase
MRNNFVEGVLLDGRFRTVAPLNHGSFGMVFKAYDTWTGDYVALKCLTKPNAVNFYAGDFAVDDRSEELVIHRRIGNHPNIIKLLYKFETEHHICLVLEYCENGDLYEAIRVGRGPGRTEHVRQCMLQLVDATEHMHINGVYHRDIKPENIMLSKDGAIKLGDFGLATMDLWSSEAAVGSDRYMAPEQYDPANVGYSPAKADVWAIGICLLNILFSRNPFAAPSLDDPLFADFANDRQTLFDVFPKMSQDTFEVLTHCVALDPAKRSLAAVRSALKRAVSFTTDDETLDDFCADDNVVVTATANRPPLRTPSIHTPQLDQGGAFPWAKALAMTPTVRQLSAIPDAELSEPALAPSDDSGSDWFAVKPDNSSVASFVDSGLGVSLKSTELQLKPETARFSRSKPVPISGSLPITMGRRVPSMSTVFGKKRDLVSKSWSDLWDEEEEENAMQSDNENEATSARGRQPWRLDANDQDTLRQVLSELKNPATVNSRNRTPVASEPREDHVSEHTGFVFEEHDTPRPGSPATPASVRYSPPSKRASTDKWAALGDRRRAHPTPSKTPAQPLTTPRKRSRAGSWRSRNIDTKTFKSPFSYVNDSTTGVLDQYQRHLSTGRNGRAFTTTKAHHHHQIEQPHPWLLSKDWRQHASPQRDDAADILSGWRRGLHL